MFINALLTIPIHFISKLGRHSHPALQLILLLQLTSAAVVPSCSWYGDQGQKIAEWQYGWSES